MKMLQSSPDLEQNSFRIKPNDEKLFSKLLSKETSKSNPSFRVYYGDVSSAVPFMWEIAPGTPKHTLSEASIPPLTPPPSHYNSTKNATKSSKNKPSRSKFLLNLLTRVSFNKVDHVGSSPSSSSVSHSLSSLSFSTSSSLSSFSDPATTVKDSRGRRSRRRFSSWGSSFDHDYDNDNHLQQVGGSSRFCFGFRSETDRRSHVKKALMSFNGRRSG